MSSTTKGAIPLLLALGVGLGCSDRPRAAAADGTSMARKQSALRPPQAWSVSALDTSKRVYGTLQDQPFAIGTTVYFSADDGVHGAELWKSDGTEAGTVLVRDLIPGARGSNPRLFTNVNGTLFFVTDDGYGSGSGNALWKSDGTEAGTVLVKELGSDPSSQYRNMVALNGTLLFVAVDSATGAELWKSDGTAAGTTLVKDIAPGTTGSNPQELIRVGTSIYFSADDGSSGRELWTSDGTPAGTYLFMDISVGWPGSSPSRLTDVNGTLFFSADDGFRGQELWKCNGTLSGTVLVRDIVPGPGSSLLSELTNVNGTLFFTTGGNLWKSDGTSAGTSLVTNAASPRFFKSFNGLLFFEQLGGLWKSDGTSGGTVEVKDVTTGLGWEPRGLTVAGGLLYFTGGDLATGEELWKSDGTSAGTVLVKDITPGGGGLGPQYLTAAGSTVLFTATDPVAGRELWKSDGTAPGTVLVKNVRPTTFPSWSMADLNGALYFASPDLPPSTALWTSDGTGASVVKDLAPGFSDVSPAWLTASGSQLFFAGHDGYTGWRLWKSDGTSDGTSPVPSSSRQDPSQLVAAGGAVYFVANDGSAGYELWKSDGSSVPGPLKDIYPGVRSSYPYALTPVGSTVYFGANDGATGFELWKSDGTAAGTVRIQDISPGATGSTPRDLVALGTTLFFSAETAGAGRELWKSDGTAAGTVQVKDILPGAAGSNPTDLTVLNGSVYFAASDGAGGRELWKSDGTAAGTVLVKDVAPGAAGSGPYFLARANGQIFFRAFGTDASYELWRTDGTAAGTVRLASISAGPTSSFDRHSFIALEPEGRLLFAASSLSAGVELWSSDGTAAGTGLIQDLATGSDSSNPRDFHRVGARVFFTTDTATGYQLWALTATVFADSTPPVITCPSTYSAEAQNASGATLAYAGASATDNVTAAPVVTYSRPSPSTFPLGTTSVTATAEDEAGNTASCTFDVIVRDTTAPAVTCPADVTAEAASASGATVSFASATATDAVTASPTVSYSQPSGGTFALGATSITVTAQDAAGNSSTCRFTVTVRDTTAPQLACPAAQLVEATSGLGAVASYPAAMATDAVSSPALSYDKPSGGQFPLGANAVTVTAQDAAGNRSTCSFTVTVRDTTAPQLACPADQSVETSSNGGTVVSYPAATSTDAVSTPTVTYEPPTGSTLPIGDTRVTVTARDAAGNSSSCTFNVNVAKVGGATGCGCSNGSGMPWVVLSLLVFGTLRARRRRPA